MTKNLRAIAPCCCLLGKEANNESRAKLNVIENQQDREDSGRDHLKPLCRKEHEQEEHEQEELEEEANSVHVGLKVTECEQERTLLPLLSMPVCHSSGIMLSMRNKIAQPRVSFAAHAHYVPPGQMDTRTNGHGHTVR